MGHHWIPIIGAMLCLAKELRFKLPRHQPVIQYLPHNWLVLGPVAGKFEKQFCGPFQESPRCLHGCQNSSLEPGGFLQHFKQQGILGDSVGIMSRLCSMWLYSETGLPNVYHDGHLASTQLCYRRWSVAICSLPHSRVTFPTSIIDGNFPCSPQNGAHTCELMLVFFLEKQSYKVSKECLS